ncbi:MAG: aminoacetone oxidase family FAD-binding enzyme, partial [Lachnospiraceae bacterium]
GRCNLTNEHMDEKCFYSHDGEFVKNTLKRFGSDDTVAFFKEMGVYTRSVNGYVYPVTAQASTIRTAMENQLYYSGVERKCKVEIISIAANSDGFEINCGDQVFICRQLILATGLKAAPSTGSDGSGISLCRKLGLEINKVLPSLVQLKSSSPVCRVISNVRHNGIITLFIDGNKAGKNEGEIQFTDYGISGIPAFQISHAAVKAVDDNKKVSVQIDLVPFMNETDIVNYIKNAIPKYPGMNIINYLSGIINNKLAVGICISSGLNKDGTAMRRLDENIINLIAKNIKKFEFEIVGYKDFENAQVCQGGVKLSELTNDFETKKISGLYIVGELTDVDGICGGYNLQWAFSSGYIAGMSVKKYD